VAIASGVQRVIVLDTLRGTRRTYPTGGCTILTETYSPSRLARRGLALLYCYRQTTPYRLLALANGRLTNIGGSGDIVSQLGDHWIAGSLRDCSGRPTCVFYISRATGRRYDVPASRPPWDIDAPAPSTPARFCDGTVTDRRAGPVAGPYRVTFRRAGGRSSSMFIAECGRKARLLARNFWSVQLSRRWLTWSWGKSIYAYSTTSRRTTRYTLPTAKRPAGDSKLLQVLHTRNRLIVGEPIRYRDDPDDSVTSVERYRIWTRRL
jgi:hypothetical protein